MAIEEVKPPGMGDEKPHAESTTPGADAVREAAEARAKPKARPGSTQLKGQVAELYVTIGMMVVTPIDRLAGMLIVKQADDIAEQWIELAETNASVKNALLKLVEVGGWGGVVMAHGMILLPVLANRGLFPDQMAQPMAAMTAMQHPETIELFTHPRFKTETASGNGHVG